MQTALQSSQALALLAQSYWLEPSQSAHDVDTFTRFLTPLTARFFNLGLHTTDTPLTPNYCP